MSPFLFPSSKVLNLLLESGFGDEKWKDKTSEVVEEGLRPLK